MFQQYKEDKNLQVEARRRADEQAKKIKVEKGVHDKDSSEILDDLVIDKVASKVQLGIGYRLAQLREAEGLTQKDIVEELSEFWPVDVTTISRWENGERCVKLPYLVWCSARFKVSLDWLIKGKEFAPIETVKLVKLLALLKRMVELYKNL